MLSEALVRVVQYLQKNSEAEILLHSRPTPLTDVTRPHSSVGTEEDPVQPYMEPARGYPLRDNSDKAQVSCVFSRC